jgi:Polyketide cyclase / dehydrase and lipid transport
MRDYRFSGTWTVPAAPEAVAARLVDLERYPSWWREIRAVASLGEDDALVVCRSWLPYSLDLHLRAVSRRLPVLQIDLDGDLVGTARWTLSPDPAGTRMVFDQQVRVTNRLLGLASYVARPLLVWNHDRMMRSCVSGLSRLLVDGGHVAVPSPRDRVPWDGGVEG